MAVARLQGAAHRPGCTLPPDEALFRSFP